MNTILLINGAKDFGSSKGILNQTLQNQAKQTLKSLGKDILETVIDDGYDVAGELEKWQKADAIIWQMPGWWMGEPWIVKKYIDDVLTAGYGVLYQNDGRSRKDESAKYGSGGLAKDKKYMFSLTWNAPLEAFTNKEHFFGGVGVDGVYLHLHKAHEFLGMSALATFICNDVVKNPQVEQYLKDYDKHLKEIFA
ncbi:flavodoxin-like fold domain protein, putative NAD(P)H (quinone) dehydrogenase/reductase [Campylobacter iguaniorum]|uniref:Flavodoxin-like fold domain protein, putative NAD(P)H (Quinone) dehydrogenase/reductase n=1 Tax=Campylobacter iguaniorum TaxID=1244531 RepID=A0A076FDM6_9BACT|nr:NAD(P)H-dependent oxidoreductase [Campylobacter iguaniorum]AII15497.1 flavodoxin-like fold domain protein, putative NAD(P)H (quinone) dehydrogenase/reductase [Campylobacter iguaniorum]ALV25411.1 flavodoxin-like fold domain protein, putative NAD(P)H (quinone) dehydrogenase/reductase [Campylobacter iguaniorum]